MNPYRPIIFRLLCWPSIGRSQAGGPDAPYQITYSRSKTGGVLLLTGAKHSLTVDIAGDSIKTTDQPNYLLVDNMVVQVSMVPIPKGPSMSCLRRTRN